MAPKDHHHLRQQSRPPHEQPELDEEAACTRRHGQSQEVDRQTHRQDTHIQTDKQTDCINNGTLHAPRYEEAFWPIGKNSLIKNVGTGNTNYAITEQARSLSLDQFGRGKTGMTTTI